MKSLLIIVIFSFFTTSLYAQKKAPKYYSSSDDVWLKALNTTAAESEVKNIIKSLGPSDTPNDMDEFQEVLRSLKLNVWRKKGIHLGFSTMPPKILNHIYFYNDSSVHRAAKKLPFGLSFSDSAESIKKKYGEHLIEDSEGDYTVQVYPELHPYVFMKINMKEGKVGHAISLYYDEYLAYMQNPSPHNLDDEPYMCDAYTAMIEDVDNKFFNFRGPKTEELFPTWESNVLIDTYEVANTKVRRDYILMTGYKGLDHDKAALAFDSLFSYFDGCIEDEDLPYSWNKVEEQTDDSFKITLTTKEKNIKIEHHFKMEEDRFSVEKQMVYDAYTKVMFSEN